MFQRYCGLFALLAVVCVTLLPGCGGSGGDGAGPDGEIFTAAANPWRGDYYCWTENTTTSTVMLLFRVLRNGTVNAIASGPYIRGGWTGTGTVTPEGVLSVLIRNVQLTGGQRTNLTIAGQFTVAGSRSAAAGTLIRSIEPGTTLQWQGKWRPGCANSGSWALTVGGVANTYNYTKAFAIIGRVRGIVGLTIIFEGPRTAWPAEGFIAVVDPQSVGLNAPKATQADALLLGNPAATRYRNYTASAKLPKITLTSRDLRRWGRISGYITGTLRNHSNSADCVLNDASFTDVIIVDDITVAN